MSGCGEPYQIESVPHTMRSGPTARSSLPSTCAASTGRRSMRYHVLPSSAYTLAPGRDARVGEARDQPVDAGQLRGRALGSYATLFAVGIALVARVVHEERDVGERGRGGTDVARRRGRDRRRRDRTAEALVHRDHRRPGLSDALEEREADLVVVEEPPAGGRRRRRRAVERVALPARRPERVVELGHVVELGAARGWDATMVWVFTRPAPA